MVKSINQIIIKKSSAFQLYYKKFPETTKAEISELLMLDL